MKQFVVLALGIFLIVSCRNKANPKPVSSDNTIPVKVAFVQKEASAHDITATGLLTTANEARLSFKITGVIDKIFVEEGQFVRKGQILATIKPTEINAQLEQAHFAHEKAERDYIRTGNLYRDGVATLEQLQNTKTGLEIARRSVEAAAFNRHYATITALSDAFITKKLANAGEVVSAGTPVLSVNETNSNKDWLLKAGITDVEWTSISVNQAAVVEVDAFPGRKFAASVMRKSQSVDVASGSFQVELRIDFNNLKPAIGMFGRATILSGNKEQFLTVPYEAIMQADGDKGFVFIPQTDSSLRKAEVFIRSFDEQKIVITSGIGAGTPVVISNSAFLNEKSRISIIK